MRGFLELQGIVRDFFRQREFWDVVTPPAVENPGMEAHLHPFALYSVNKRKVCEGRYLHTSPEFSMKELLSQGYDKIFTLSYVFRDEPVSEDHRFQFLMLEWYRVGVDYEKIMQDCQQLIRRGAEELAGRGHPVRFKGDIEWEKKTVDELFREVLGFSILDYLDGEELRNLMVTRYPEIPLPGADAASLDWEDYYFLLFFNKIEPLLREIPALLLYEFPHPLAALSTLKETDERVCRRFEIYLHGTELCNCFHELTDLAVLKKRFAREQSKKKGLYGHQLPSPERFYRSMERGLPPSSGIALGMERFYKGLTGEENPFWD